MFATSEINVTTNVGIMQRGSTEAFGKRQGTLEAEKTGEFIELDLKMKSEVTDLL
jgi:hypothetical protein